MLHTPCHAPVFTFPLCLVRKPRGHARDLKSAPLFFRIYIESITGLRALAGPARSGQADVRRAETADRLPGKPEPTRNVNQMAFIGTVIIVALALFVAWVITALPLEAMTRRFLMALLGVTVLLWLVKVFVGFGNVFTWRP
jgi:hypothetical protein